MKHRKRVRDRARYCRVTRPTESALQPLDAGGDNLTPRGRSSPEPGARIAETGDRYLMQSGQGDRGVTHNLDDGAGGHRSRRCFGILARQVLRDDQQPAAKRLTGRRECQQPRHRNVVLPCAPMLGQPIQRDVTALSKGDFANQLAETRLQHPRGVAAALPQRRDGSDRSSIRHQAFHTGDDALHSKLRDRRKLPITGKGHHGRRAYGDHRQGSHPPRRPTPTRPAADEEVVVPARRSRRARRASRARPGS